LGFWPLSELMEHGVEFQIYWSANDLLDLRVAAWNGLFGGVAGIYIGIGDLQAVATQLRGFPNSPADERGIELGSLERKYAGGGIRMRFHCVDGAGHAYVEITIDSNCTTGGTVETVVMTVPIEAAAVDVFVEGLAMLELKRTGTAHLKARDASRF
jgi:hypothetical protein